jgi:SpoVK/Ycf46/Vps4 family AAA+-type ATPase
MASMLDDANAQGAGQAELQRLLLAQHPCLYVVTCEEGDVLDMVRAAAIEVRLPLSVWSINGGLRDGLLSDSAPLPDTEHPAAALYHLSLQIKPMVAVMLDVAGHLKDERTLRHLRDAVDAMARIGGTLVLIDGQDSLPLAIRSAARQFEPPLPDEGEIERIVRATLRRENERRRLDVDLSRQDLTTIVRNLRGLSRRQASRVIMDVVCEDRRLDRSDIGRILAEKRRALQSSGLLEFVQTPNHLDEVGGLSRLKTWLKQRQRSLSDEARAFGIPAPRGLLMLGIQGAGKSLAAKAVATAWQMPLMRMDAGALYDKYIGESERRLRDSLSQAEMMSPVILWIDEIEKAFASAASRSTDGGLSQRMFATILTWMQEHTAPVFLVATANDIEALPPELLRKGRFDEIFFVDLPGEEARRQIFEIHLKKRNREPAEYDLGALVAASVGFSGAEIEQAVVSGLHQAFADRSELTASHILHALRSSPPLSVTMAERLAALRAWAKGRCVPAD